MDKYLLLLLKEVNTIIIPDLGALTITNSASGEIMFMPYLKYDDGKLATYISEKEGLNQNDAKNLIAKYVRDVQAVIAKGEEYSMFEFGTFLKDKSGEIVFKNWDGSIPVAAGHDMPKGQDIVEGLDSPSLGEVSEVTPEEPQSHIVEEIKQETPEKNLEIVAEVVEKVAEEPKEVVAPPKPNYDVNETLHEAIDDVHITPEKDIEVKISENHALVVRNTGKVEVLSTEGTDTDRFVSKPVEYIPKTPENKLVNKSEDKIEAPKEVTKAEAEKVVDEIKEQTPPAPPAEVIPPKVETPPVPKPELSAEELEAKRIKNAEREAEREKRLAERMEKLANKGMPAEETAPAEEKKSDEKPVEAKATQTEEPQKKVSKKEAANEEKPKDGRSFVVQKTANQKSSILLATIIIAIGLFGGLAFILYNGSDISAPKVAEAKELAQNNQNLANKENKNFHKESSSTTTIVIETKKDENTAIAENSSEEKMEAAKPEKVEEVKPKEKAMAASKPVTPKPVAAKPAPVKVAKAKPVAKPKKAPKPQVADVSTSGTFQVIGGSFAVEENANHFIDKMVAAGKNAKLLGKIKDMYVVTYGSFNSKEEAVAEIHANHLKAWVLKQ